MPQVKEYEPEDGWELVYKQFGEKIGDIIIPNSQPNFALYNRKTGKLRMFFYYSVTNTDWNSMYLGLKFSEEDNFFPHITAALEHLNIPAEAIENYTDANLAVQVPNESPSTEGLWIFADIPIAYDPCTCQYSSGIRTYTRGFLQTDIDITLQGNGTIEQVVDGNGTNTTSDKTFGI